MNFVVLGSSGKMGQELKKALLQRKHNAICIDRSGQGDYRSLLEVKHKKIHGVIDFTSEEGLLEAIAFCADKKIPLISGTTGLSSRAYKQIKQATKKTAILWAPNMSIGILVMRKCIQQLKHLGAEFDFQIEDIHHKQKKDAPSGTALLLQSELKKAVGVKKAIPDVFSIRAGGVFGVHKLLAISSEETLTIEHQALSRAVFAKGAVVAAEWLSRKKRGLYNFESLF